MVCLYTSHATTCQDSTGDFKLMLPKAEILDISDEEVVEQRVPAAAGCSTDTLGSLPSRMRLMTLSDEKVENETAEEVDEHSKTLEVEVEKEKADHVKTLDFGFVEDDDGITADVCLEASLANDSQVDTFQNIAYDSPVEMPFDHTDYMVTLDKETGKVEKLPVLSCENGEEAPHEPQNDQNGENEAKTHDGHDEGGARDGDPSGAPGDESEVPGGKYPLEPVSHHILDQYEAKLKLAEVPHFAAQGKPRGHKKAVEKSVPSEKKAGKKAKRSARMKAEKPTSELEKHDLEGESAHPKKRSKKAKTQEGDEAWENYGPEEYDVEYDYEASKAEDFVYEEGTYNQWWDDDWAEWEDADWVEEINDEDEEEEEEKAKPKKKRQAKTRAKGQAKARAAAKAKAAKAASKSKKTGEDEENESKEVARPADAYVPPPHVHANGVYSSAYRKAISQGLGTEVARSRGKEAADIFRAHGVVNELCGQFRTVKAKENKRES